MAQGTYVCSLGTGDLHPNPGQIYPVYLYVQNLHRPWLAFHFLSRPCQLVQLLSVHLKGGVHGRYLGVIAPKSHDSVPYLFPGKGQCPFPIFCQNGSCGVLGVCLTAQKHNGLVCLGPVRQHVAQPGARPQTNRKDSFSRWVQGSCMAYFFLF